MMKYHFRQFVLSFRDAFPVVGINDKDQALRVLKVMPPQGSDLVLTADIPNGETDVLVFDGFHIETCQRSKVNTRF